MNEKYGADCGRTYDRFEAALSEIGTDPSLIIPMLQALQEEFGYISDEVITWLSERTGVFASKIRGVVTFYSQFRTSPLGKNVIRICFGTACHVNGAQRIADALCDELCVGLDEVTPDGLFSIEKAMCLGCCSLAPVMAVGDEIHGGLTPDKARKIVRQIRQKEVAGIEN